MELPGTGIDSGGTDGGLAAATHCHFNKLTRIQYFKLGPNWYATVRYNVHEIPERVCRSFVARQRNNCNIDTSAEQPRDRPITGFKPSNVTNIIMAGFLQAAAH
jgi:hypothetical protein